MNKSKIKWIILTTILVIFTFLFVIAFFFKICSSDIREMCNLKSGEKWTGSSYCHYGFGLFEIGADKLEDKGWVDCQ